MDYSQRNDVCWISTPRCIQKIAYIPAGFYPPGNPENSTSCVAKTSQYDFYGFTLGALALKPSGFCSDRAYVSVAQKRDAP